MYKVKHAPWVPNKHLFIGAQRARQEEVPHSVLK